MSVFVTVHPVFSVMLALMAFILCEHFIRLCNRFFRTLNIKRSGWPPVHLDADGDFRPALTDPDADGAGKERVH